MWVYCCCVQGIIELVGVLCKQEEKVWGEGVQMYSELVVVNCDCKKILCWFLCWFEEKEM